MEGDAIVETNEASSMKVNIRPTRKEDTSSSSATPQGDPFNIEQLFIQNERLKSRNKQLSKLVKVFVMSIPLFESEFDTSTLSLQLHEKLKTHFKCSEVRELIENWHTDESKKERDVRLGKKTLKNTTKRLRKRIVEIEAKFVDLQERYQKEQRLSKQLLAKNDTLKEEKDHIDIELELQNEHMQQLKTSLNQQILSLTQQLATSPSNSSTLPSIQPDDDDEPHHPSPIHQSMKINIANSPLLSPTTPLSPQSSGVSMDRRLELLSRKHRDTIDAIRQRFQGELDELHHLIDQHEQREHTLEQQLHSLQHDYKVLQDSHIIKDCRIKDMSDRISKLTYAVGREQKNKALIKQAFQRYQINGDPDDVDFQTLFHHMGGSMDLTNDFLHIQQPKGNVVSTVLHNTNHNNNVHQRANTSASRTRIPRLRAQSRQDASKLLASSLLQTSYDDHSSSSASTSSFSPSNSLTHNSFLPRQGRSKHTNNSIHYMVDSNPRKLIKRKRNHPLPRSKSLSKRKRKNRF